MSQQSSQQKEKEFAVIETGGKQYIVSAGDVIDIEKLPEKQEGDKVTFDKVLLVDDGENTSIGTPYIEGAKVVGTLREEGKGPKIRIMRFKRKTRYFKTKGHRQPYTRVKIEEIK